MSRQWLWMIGAVLVGGAVLVAGNFGYAYLSRGIDDDDDTPAGIPAEQMDPSATLNGRPDLRVCVDHIGDVAETSPDDVAFVRSAFDQALVDAPYVPPFYAEHPAIIEIGCRSPRSLSDERIGFEDRNSLRPGQIVGSDEGRETMSPYKVSVYFTEPEVYAVAFGNAAYATSSEEYGCRGDVCQAVTGGIYAPDGDLAEDDLAFALRISLGLFSLQEARDWISQQD